MKRHQYGLMPIIAADRVWFCKCGHAVDAGHNHTCNRVRGPATFHRHQCVVHALIDVATHDCGLMVETTPRVYSELKNRDENDYVIPDIVFNCNEFRLAIDVSGVYGESASYLPQKFKAGLSECELRGGAVLIREMAKARHYADLPRRGESDFLPFVFESHGGLGIAAEKVISRLAKYGAEQNGCTTKEMSGYIKRVVAIAIQRGNAGLDSVARQKQAGSYGAMVARGYVVVSEDN